MFPTLDDIRERLPDDLDRERFLARVAVGPVPAHNPALGPCVVWTRGCDSSGYGAFKSGGRQYRAHVWLYQALGGIIPAGMELDHICHEPKLCTAGVKCPHRPCVVHVLTRTRIENVLRGNGPTAINAAKTRCHGKYSPRAADGTVIGHDLTDPANVYIAPSGSRKCIPCQREREHAWYERAKTLRIRARQRNLADAGQLAMLDL